VSKLGSNPHSNGLGFSRKDFNLLNRVKLANKRIVGRTKDKKKKTYIKLHFLFEKEFLIGN